MVTQSSSQTIKLFYSYSHRDTRFKEKMERSLHLLKKDGLLIDWSDRSILPGQNISSEVRSNLDNSDIIVFLVSPDFIASSECIKEWNYARELSHKKSLIFRIPIIIRECPWPDLLADDDLKALPDDGVAVSRFSDDDLAWKQVYEGIKLVVDKLRNTFTVKKSFLKRMEHTEFLSQKRIRLQDIYVFLPLICRGSQTNEIEHYEETITTEEDLLKKNYALIHGTDRSGKTTLGRHLFITLTTQSRPVLYVDLNQISQEATDNTLKEIYESQFNGDYTLWKNQPRKTIILDNLSGRPDLVEFVVSAKQFFDHIIITLSSSVFYSFYRDEERLADFEELEIGILTHVQQEILIRKRLSLASESELITDGYVDRVEDRVNSIIIDNRVVPRFPFFVLCILQTYEGFMPSGLAITSYGHCYYALIVASLVRAGISRQDSDITTCFNFAEHLAFSQYEYAARGESSSFDFNRFVRGYRQKFIIPNNIVNRLKHRDFGLIDQSGQFRSTYMQYFFLGRFLSKDSVANRAIIERMCDATHLPSNYLTLLFTIHHTTDLAIIDDILLRTMVTLDDVQIAQLDREETRRFRAILSGIPRNILSGNSVESERRREREALDSVAESATDDKQPEEGLEERDWTDVEEAVNGCYRVLKNNEIMGQILRNKYGSMTIDKIEEIIEIMADGGLRLVNLVLKDENEIREMAHYFKVKNPDYDIQEIRKDLERFSFIWTMVNVEHIVGSMNVPEIRAAIESVVKNVATPAYDVIGYFTLLDAAPELRDRERNELDRLLKKYDDPFVKGVLSIRTQHYMNTHRSSAMLEQSICALLNIKYLPRPLPSR